MECSFFTVCSASEPARCFNTSGLAEAHSGTTLYASCAGQQKTAACNPTASTDGNEKAAQALNDSNNSADRAKDPNAPSSRVMAFNRSALKPKRV
jgi:thiamine biosynthesis lipoprotein ApbE